MPSEHKLCRSSRPPPPSHMLPAPVRVNSGFTPKVPKADLDEKFL